MDTELTGVQAQAGPYFSVVLPAYGVEAYIADALRDLQAQSFGDWEAIVVDDCSPDGSRAVADAFAAGDARVRVVSHDVNRGLSAARNTGLEAARGRYVWFADPDDRYDLELLRRVRDSLKARPAPVVLMGHKEVFFDVQAGGSEPVRTVEFAREDACYEQDDLRKVVLQFEKETRYGYAWNKVYEREYLLERGLRFSDVPLIEDIEFNVRVFQDLPSLNVVGAPLYSYAKREGGNLTNKFVPRYYEVHRQRIQMLRDQQDSWGLLNDPAKATLGALYARYILSALERNCCDESGMDAAARKAWIQGVFEDPLFNELIPGAQADSTALRACLPALKKRNAGACLRLGSALHSAKSGTLHGLFTKLKAGR